MKSVNAFCAGRIKNRTCKTPMVKLVTPMGTTSKTHQVPPRRNTASAPLASLLKIKCFPVGSIASGHGGEKLTTKKSVRPINRKTIRFQSKFEPVEAIVLELILILFS